MTSDFLPYVSATVPVVCLLGGLFYMRGKIDSAAEMTRVKLDETKEETKAELRRLSAYVEELRERSSKADVALGARAVTDQIGSKLVRDVDKLKSDVIENRVSFKRHEEECGRRQDDIMGRFDKLERRLDNIQAQLTAIVMGTAGQLYEIPASRASP